MFLEGIVPRELKYMLNGFIYDSKYFTLKWLKMAEFMGHFSIHILRQGPSLNKLMKAV